MRYIYYVIAILLLASSLLAYQVLRDRPSQKDAALVINDRVITHEELERLYAAREPHLKDREDFINALITRELLIQEAKKLGIDREEAFRKSIQSFYEQSLIKLLIDRKLASLTVMVREDELERYIELLPKRLHLTIFTADSADSAERSAYSGSEQRTVFFEDLSDDLKQAILPLKEGEKTGPIRMGGKYLVARLDRTEEGVRRPLSEAQISKIRETLVEAKREKIFNEWIENLSRSCTVTDQIDRSLEGR